MKSIPPTAVKLHGHVRKLLVGLTMVALAFVTLFIVHSQNPPSPTLKGESAKVLLAPNRTVNAGEVKFKPDSDHDGMTDEAEAQNGTNPNDASDADGDADNDGLTNGDEVAGGSGVNNSDSDGDGVSDGEEARLGFNPSDPSNTPPSNVTLVSIRVSPLSIALNINTLLGQEFGQLQVTGVLSNGATTDLTRAPGTTYQSLDTAVVFVDDFGSVGGVAAGATAITVANGGFTAQAQVSVSTFTPGKLSTVFIPDTANSVAVSDNYAYVAAGSAGLQVVDVSNRLSPSIVGSLDTPGNATDIKVAGSVAYLADGPGGLRVIDVSNPIAPMLLAVVNTPGLAQDVVVYEGRAYVAAEVGGLQIIDVNNPASPVLLGAAATPGRARGVDVTSGLALVACEPTGGQDGTITVFDVSNPAAPQQVATLGVQGAPIDLIVRDRFAYVAKDTGGTMTVVDFISPTRPLVLMTDDFGLGTADVAASGRYAFFATTPFVLSSLIYDLDDPSSPRYSGSLNFSPPTNYTGTGVTVDGPYLYQTGYHDFFGALGRSSLLFIGQYQAAPAQPGDSDGIAPTVTVSAPQNGETVSEGSALLVSATAADDVRVSAVRFTINGVTVATDVVAPYEFTYSVPVGSSSLSIRANAIDSAGNSRDSDAVTVTVTSDPPPTVTILQPQEGAQVTQGLTANVLANASDNVQVTKIDFFINGVKIQNTSFNSTTFDVPLGISSLSIEARATDNLGRTGSATRTVSVIPYTGPTTTVTGRVLDGPDLPVPGLSVSVFNVFTTQTGPDGTFTLPGVPTVRGSITARVGGEFNGRTISRTFGNLQPVAGGVTNLGDLTLTRRHLRDLTQAPTAAASGFGITHVITTGDDFFFGFANSNRLYWAGGFFAGQDGVLIQWTSTATLPPGGVKSADVSHGHIYAQLKNQPGLVTDFSFAFNLNNFRWEPHSVSLATGLDGECDGIAAGKDNGQRQVLAFLAATAEGSDLKVRIGQQDVYAPPVTMPVELGARLRTPKLEDINHDGLVDLLLIRQVSETESRLVVYPRISAEQFGAPVESPITVRSTVATLATVDYAVAEFDGSMTASVAVLGDDRVRIYSGDATGAFSPAGELALPAGTIPLAVDATSYHKDHPAFSDVAASLVVSTAAADSPGSRSAHVFINKGSGFAPARVFGYLVAADAPTAGARVFVNTLNGYQSSGQEVVVVDGRYLTALYDIVPISVF